jgi:hypothetical protein
LKQHDQSRFPPEERVVSRGPIIDLELTRSSPPLFVDHCFSQLDLRLGSGSAEIGVEIVSGLDWPQLDARYVVVEPKAVEEDPRRGWLPLGGVYADRLVLGPETAGALLGATRTAPEVAQVLLSAYETYISITACSTDPIGVRISIGDMLSAAGALERAAAQAA